MKRSNTIAAFLLAASCAGLNAQVTVVENGQTIFGNRYKSSLTLPGTRNQDAPAAADLSGAGLIDYNTPVSVDSLATVVFLGKTENKSGAYLSFGTSSQVRIGEVAYTSTTLYNGTLDLYGQGGLQIRCKGGDVFKFACNTKTNTFSQAKFFANVAAPSFITTSDYRLKQDVESVGEDYRSLWDLNPVSYRLNGAQSEPSANEPRAVAISEDGSAADLSTDDRLHYGFIAQEVHEIFPELVVEDENGYLGIDYQGFIPLLVEAVKNLRAEVVSQAEEIARLKGENAPAKKNTAEVADTRVELIASGASLSQNRPNPFNARTEIDCCIPETLREATLYVFDLQGKTVETVAISDRGATKIVIDGSKLRPGMYLYTLVADGTEIDTRRMILTE